MQGPQTLARLNYFVLQKYLFFVTIRTLSLNIILDFWPTFVFILFFTLLKSQLHQLLIIGYIFFVSDVWIEIIFRCFRNCFSWRLRSSTDCKYKRTLHFVACRCAKHSMTSWCNRLFVVFWLQEWVVLMFCTSNCKGRQCFLRQKYDLSF